MSTHDKRLTLLLVSVLALAVATLACNPLAGLTGVEETAAPVAEDAPEEQEAERERPTNTPRPAPTATPEPAGLTPSTVGDLRQLRVIDVSNNVMLSAVFSPLGGHGFFSIGGDTVLQQWNADTGDRLLEKPAHSGFGWALAFSPDGSMLASAAEDFRVIIWDPVTGDQIRTIQTNSAGFRVAWSPDSSQLVVVGDYISRAEVFDVATGAIAAEPKTGSRPLFGAAWSADGTMMAVSDIGRNVFIYDPNNDFSLITQFQSEGTGWDLEFSPDGRYLSTCNAGGNVEMWDTGNWSRVFSVQAYYSQCGDAVFNADGDVLVTSGDDRLIFWEPATGDVLREIPIERFGWWVSLSADGERLVMAQDDGKLIVYGMP